MLLVAHLFSDVLAHTVAAQDDPDWSEILTVGREDFSVAAGALAAATIMAFAAVAGLDAGLGAVIVLLENAV